MSEIFWNGATQSFVMIEEEELDEQINTTILFINKKGEITNIIESDEAEYKDFLVPYNSLKNKEIKKLEDAGYNLDWTLNQEKDKKWHSEE